MKVLVVNAGSSSLKYQLFDTSDYTVKAKGICERIGEAMGVLDHKNLVKGTRTQKDMKIATHTDAVRIVIDALTDPEVGVISDMSEIEAVGHRIVHGGFYFSKSMLLNDEVLSKLELCHDFAPLHTGAHLQGIRGCLSVMPGVPQVLVFDTAFHQTMPAKSYIYALPYEYYEKDKVRRYGFHGTSHKYVTKRAIELMGRKDIKLVNCHLGNGSSLSAVKDGKCQDTSMGLTPLAGVPMGTRSGDIDPAVVQFVMNKYGMSADECLNMLNKKSGVLALSGVSSDFRDIENGAEEGNENCALALDKFAYEVRKYIGSYAAALGGLDCLVFTAGVGENSASMRARICEGLEFLGVKLDPEKNNTRGKEAIISADDSKVTVWVIPTNEELMIAQDTAALVNAAK